MSEKVTLEQGSVSKLFFKFAIPSIFGMFVVSIQMMVDGMFLSYGVGPIGLAAINLSMPLINFLLSIGLMICIGGGVIVGIYNGNKKINKARELSSITLILLFIVLFTLSVTILLNADFFIRLLGANDEIFPYVKTYLTPMLLGSFFYSSPIFTETFVRIAGRPNFVFLSGLISLIVNAILDYIFIIKFNMGMLGGGTATIIACAASFFLLLPFIHFKRPSKNLKKYYKDIISIFYNGSSEMFTTVASTVSMYLFNLTLMKNIGVLGVSALTIVFYVNLILGATLYGLSQALQPIVSFNVGAKNFEKIKTVLKISLITAGAIGVTTYIGTHIGGDKIIRIFSKNNKELIEITKEALFFVSFSYLISFINIIATSFFTAIERPLESVVVSLCRSIIFIVIPLLTLPRFMGAVGIWLSIPVAETCTLIFSFLLMKSSLKRLARQINNYNNHL